MSSVRIQEIGRVDRGIDARGDSKERDPWKPAVHAIAASRMASSRSAMLSVTGLSILSDGT